MANTVSVQVLADVRDMTKGIQQVNGQLSSLGDGVSKVTGFVKKMVTGFIALQAVRGAVSFLKDSVTAASDLSETVNKSNTIFGQNAAIVNKWAQTSATSVGLSRAAALEAASGFGNMFTQLGFAGDQAANMSTQVVQMSADLGSFNNLPTADVADKISGAFRGEYDSLQALIPNINAARVESEAMAMTGKTVAAELTAQEKAAAVLAIVNKDGAAAMGDFARTSDGLANKQKILAAKFEDVKAVVGNALLPIMSALASFILDKVVPAAQAMATWFGDNVVPKLKELWNVIQTNVLPVLQSIGSFIMDTIVPALQDMAKFVQENSIWFETIAVGIGAALAVFQAYNAIMGVITLVTKGWAAAQALLNAIMLINPFVAIIAGIVALVAMFIYAWKNSETFRDVVTGVWESVKGAVMAVLNWFTGTLWPGIQAVWNGITNGLGAVKDFFVNAWTAMVSFVSSIPSRITGFFSGIAGWFSNLWSGIKNFAVDAWNGLLGFIRGLPGQIMGVFSNAGSWLLNTGKNIIEGLWNGIKSMGSWIVSKITSFAKSMIPGPIAKVLGISSPSKLMAEYGRYTVQGLRVGLENNAGVRAVKNASADLARAVAGGFGAPQLAVAGSAAGAGSARGGDIHIHFDGPVIGDRDQIGRYVIQGIQAYEAQNGSAWRSR